VDERVVFQRFLGHLEILNGYRWQEVDTEDCYLCAKWTYSVFMFDKRIGSNENIMKTHEKRLIGN